MGGEQSQKRKRTSDGGLQRAEGGDGPVRILPEENGNSAEAAAGNGGEWILEFGAGAHDDPTTRLPDDGDVARPLRPGTLYTPATAQHASYAQTPPPKSQPIQPPSEPAFRPYADSEPTHRQAPMLLPSPVDRNMAERPIEREEKQPVTIIKRGPTPCAILAATFGVIAIACALLTFATVRDGFSGLGNLFGWVPNLFGPPKVSIDTSRPSIIEKVSALSKLETVHYEIEKVVEGRSQGPLWDIFTSDKILLIAHGDVIAGVDLSKLKPDDIKVMTSTNSVTIKLPKAEVFNPTNILDSTRTRVYDRSGGIIPMTDPNLETRIRQVAEEQILQAAIEDGIMSKAQKNAEDVIRSLVEGLGYKEVKFENGP